MTTGVDQTAVQSHHFTVLSRTNAEDFTIDQITAGAVAKRVETTYSNNSTYRQTKHILGIPTIVKIKDAGGTVVSQSEMGYS